VKITIKKPSECSKKEIKNFYELALKGEQVDKEGLLARIGNARYLAFWSNDDKIVSIAALKIPNESYKKDVFKKAGINKESERYDLELGYAVTVEEFRGERLCRKLVKELLDTSKNQNVFATTYNSTMQTILEENRFHKIGNPYRSKKSYINFLKLFVKEKENLYE
jgi:predicted GNAT family N-acyltransferase